MYCLLDGDLLPYEMGSLTKKKPKTKKEEREFCPDIKVGELLPFEVCWGAVQSKIKQILEAVGATDYTIYLSSQEIKTWRLEAATIFPYKGHRDDKEKPPYWDLIRKNLQLHYNVEMAEFIEADDAMSIRQYACINEAKTVHLCKTVEDFQNTARTVICSRDKDLRMVPGWHYSWKCGDSKEKPLWWQGKLGGLREFYGQMLTGDTADNIPGLYNVGEKSDLVKQLKVMKSEKQMFEHVFTQYHKRFGSYAEQFMRENGLLLHMQVTREDRWDDWHALLADYQEDQLRKKLSA